MVTLISVPSVGVGVLNAPIARRLTRGDVKMQMRPAAAAALFSQQTQALAQILGGHVVSGQALFSTRLPRSGQSLQLRTVRHGSNWN